MKRTYLAAIALLALVLLSGCVSTSDYMTSATGPAPTANSDKALVVFMRPSNLGGMIQSSVYRTEGSGNEFIGIVSANTKTAYLAEPGEHLFMVVAENADFVNATVEAGKTYYVLVSPRMGVWKARFSLLPIHNDPAAKYNLASADFAEWQRDTRWVEKSASADAWYTSHEADIAEKQADYMQKWNEASAEQKAELTLHAKDGV